MATREEKLAAVEAAFELAGTVAERWLAAYEAVRLLEPTPPPTQESGGLEMMLLGQLKPTTPELEQELRKAQDMVRAVATKILATP